MENSSDIQKSIELQKEAENCIKSLDAKDLRCNYFIEAGAGSGKTFLLTERIVNLIASGTATINEICAITFTKRMAEEFAGRLKERFADKMEEDFPKGSAEYRRCESALHYLNGRKKYNRLDQCFLGTIDSFCFQFVKKYKAVRFEGIEPIVEELKVTKDDGARINKCVADLDEADIKKLGADVYKKGLKLLIKNEGLELDAIGEGKDQVYDDYIRCLKEMKAHYDALKEEGGVFTYQDIMLRVRDILKSEAACGGALMNYFMDDTGKKYFFLDEFQDTSPIQTEIFFYLTHVYRRDGSTFVTDWRDCRPRAGSLFIVGDSKQSIYHFRGADLYSYLDVKNMFEEKGIGKVLYLTYNRRSTPSLIESFNDCFKTIFNTDDSKVGFNDIPPLPGKDKESEIEKDKDKNKNLLDGVFKYEAWCGKKYQDDKNYTYKTNETMIAQIIATIVDNEDYKIMVRREKNGPKIIDKIRYEDICVIQYSRKNLGNTATALRNAGIDYYLLVKEETQEEKLEKERAMNKQNNSSIEAYSIDENDMVEASEYDGSEETDDLFDVVEETDNRPDVVEEKNHDNQVWLTTIHTSKGDEKPVVILGYSWPTVFEPDSVRDESEKKWYFNGFYDWDGNASIKNPELKSEKMAQMLAKERSIQQQEMKNLVYVAATRAQNALFICDSQTAAKEAGYENKNRWSDLLGEATLKKLDISRGFSIVREHNTLKPVDLPMSDVAKKLENLEGIDFGEQGNGII